MAIALVSSTIGQTGPNSATTTAINTTSANLIVVFISSYAGGATVDGVLSDSKGNTWIGLAGYSAPTFPIRSRLYYCLNPSVGTGHTFTITGNDTYASIGANAYSGVGGLESESGNSANPATTLQTGNLNPLFNNSLLITGLSFGAASTASIDSSFIISNQANWNSGVSEGGAVAYKIQTSASAENPTWTIGSSTQMSTVMAVFTEQKTYRALPAGTMAWWKADSIAGQDFISSIGDGQQIDQWRDSSINNYTGLASSGFPTYESNELNGLPAIYFNTSGSGFTTSLSASANAFTIFFVMRPDNLTGVKFTLDSSANGGISGRYNNNNNRIDKKGTNVLLQYGSPSITDFQATTYSYDGLVTGGAEYVNGTSVNTTATLVTMTASLTHRIAPSTAGLKIAEIIVYHTKLSDPDRAEVHSYIQDKYGIMVSDYVGSTSGQIKAYNGTSFISKPVKVWNGTSWTVKPVKHWNGTTWVTTPY